MVKYLRSIVGSAERKYSFGRDFERVQRIKVSGHFLDLVPFSGFLLPPPDLRAGVRLKSRYGRDEVQLPVPRVPVHTLQHMHPNDALHTDPLHP